MSIGHGSLTGRMLAAVMTLAGALFLAAPAQAQKLTITAGSPGGGYFQAAAALAEYIKAEIPGVDVTVIPGGGWANVERLESSLADIAVLTNSEASMAKKGEAPGGKKYDFRMLASFRGPSVAQAAIAADTGIKSWDDVKAKKFPIRVTMLEPAQIVTPIGLDLMAEYGVTKENIEAWGGKVIHTSQKDAIRMIHDGLADMWFNGGAFYPHDRYIEFGTKKKFVLLPFSKEVAQKVADKYGLDVEEVPADIYKAHGGTNAPYWSPSLVVTFGVRKDLPDDLVEKIAAAFAKHKEDFYKVNPQHTFYKPETAWKNIGVVPLHPGAEKFYKSAGYMK